MSSLQLSGSLNDIPLPDIARLLQSTRRSGKLALWMEPSGGSIFFERGEITDSQASQMSGLDALRHLALFNRGTFVFEDDVASTTRTLGTYQTSELIRMLETRMQEARQIFELMPGENEIPRYLGGAIPTGFEVNAAELAVAMKSSAGNLGTAHLAHELQLDLTMVRYTLARFRAFGLVEIVEGQIDPWEAPYVERPQLVQVEEKALPPTDPATAPAALNGPRYWRGRKIE